MAGMTNFDEQDFLRRGEVIYARRPVLEAMADEAWAAGVNNVLICSVGGSQATMEPFSMMVDRMSGLPVRSVLAPELLAAGCNIVGPGTLAFMASKSGDTAETVAAAKWLRERGTKIFSSTGPDASPLAALSDYAFHFGDGRPLELPFYLFVGRLLSDADCFVDYEDFADACGNLASALVAVRKQYDQSAVTYAERYAKAPYHIWVASGDLWPVCYSYAMCVLEESLWIRTKSVKSPEFFHGTLELLEDRVPLTLLVGEGPTRELDLRVERFAREHTNELTVIDAASFELPGIPERWRALLGPAVMNAALQRISKNLEHMTNHSLDIRRYYRKGDY